MLTINETVGVSCNFGEVVPHKNGYGPGAKVHERFEIEFEAPMPVFMPSVRRLPMRMILLAVQQQTAGWPNVLFTDLIYEDTTILVTCRTPDDAREIASAMKLMMPTVLLRAARAWRELQR